MHSLEHFWYVELGSGLFFSCFSLILQLFGFVLFSGSIACDFPNRFHRFGVTRLLYYLDGNRTDAVNQFKWVILNNSVRLSLFVWQSNWCWNHKRSKHIRQLNGTCSCTCLRQTMTFRRIWNRFGWLSREQRIISCYLCYGTGCWSYSMTDNGNLWTLEATKLQMISNFSTHSGK